MWVAQNPTVPALGLSATLVPTPDASELLAHSMRAGEVVEAHAIGQPKSSFHVLARATPGC